MDAACRGSDVTVKLIFGCTSTSLPAAKQSPPPGTLVEFYGEPLSVKGEQVVDGEATEQAYQRQVEEFQKQAATQIRVGQSVHMLSLPVKKPPAPLLGPCPAQLWETQKMLPFLLSKKADGSKSSAPEGSKQEEAAKQPEEL